MRYSNATLGALKDKLLRALTKVRFGFVSEKFAGNGVLIFRGATHAFPLACVCVRARLDLPIRMPLTKHMRVLSARREGRGCRIAGRGLVFTLISHRVSRGCQTLRPPPCGAPSFHRIRASRVPIPPLLFLLFVHLFLSRFSSS